MSYDNTRYYGKYRGKVSDIDDPSSQGRIKARVDAILQDKETNWALPCSPFAGPGVGFFFIPPIGANVWIEFEAGNLETPIWSGCFWGCGADGRDEISELRDSLNPKPTYDTLPQAKIIKTKTATITINEVSNSSDYGVSFETTTGLKLKMTSKSIKITNGKSTLEIDQDKVAINGDALVVNNQ